MAKPLGLTARGSSKVVRIVVPKDLRETYGRTDFRITLKAREGPAVKAEAHRVRVQKDAEFEAKRKELAGVVNVIETITPELSQAIAQGVYAATRCSNSAGSPARSPLE